MKITLSVIEANLGSIGGHTKPSAAMPDAGMGAVGARSTGGS